MVLGDDTALGMPFGWTPLLGDKSGARSVFASSAFVGMIDVSSDEEESGIGWASGEGILMGEQREGGHCDRGL